jgi:hypothetical protein
MSDQYARFPTQGALCEPQGRRFCCGIQSVERFVEQADVWIGDKGTR